MNHKPGCKSCNPLGSMRWSLQSSPRLAAWCGQRASPPHRKWRTLLHCSPIPSIDSPRCDTLQPNRWRLPGPHTASPYVGASISNMPCYLYYRSRALSITGFISIQVSGVGIADATQWQEMNARKWRPSIAPCSRLSVDGTCYPWMDGTGQRWNLERLLRISGDCCRQPISSIPSAVGPRKSHTWSSGNCSQGCGVAATVRSWGWETLGQPGL
jgi:hypothetical protein